MTDTISRALAGILGLLTVSMSPAASGSRAQAHPGPISLAGEWRFAADPQDAGIGEQWYLRQLDSTCRLPGSMCENGYGNEVTADTPWTGTVVNRMWHQEERFAPYRRPGNTKIMFWLQPDKHYIGPAWYQRDIEIPEACSGRHIALELERCHWETRAWLDDTPLGTADSLATPHVYALPAEVAPGPHRLTIRVDNTVRIEVGPDAHSVSDNTQSNWNGIVGAIAMVSRDLIRMEDVQVYPDLGNRAATVRLRVINDTGAPAKGRISLAARAWNGPVAHEPAALAMDAELGPGMRDFEMRYDFGEAVQTWDEFAPNLYKLTATVDADGGDTQYHDAFEVDFGMRAFGTDGTQFTMNGRKIFLRGTLECCIFPRTGYPPTDMDSWIKVLEAARAHGLNHLRFHSWCPPEAAFAAADRLGFVFQIECDAWARVGDGAPVDAFVREEGDRILRAYGNHPSFCMLAYGNEPGGPKHKEYLAGLVEYWKAKDPRRLYTGASGWPILLENQYHVAPQPRVQAWGGGLGSRYNAQPFSTRTDYREFVAKHDVPVVSHEIGQWCVFPNLDEIPKYTGVLKPRNFEIFRDLLAANHMLGQAHDFLMASGKLQALCYKEEIEAALRTPGFGGFQLLDLHDFPGQGTALVGVLDPFWESKGYISADEYRAFCGPTVPLLRMDRCVWTTDETFVADAEIAHYGAGPIENARPRWSVHDSAGGKLASGEFAGGTIPIGNCTSLGPVAFPLAQVKAPCRLRITVELTDTPWRNGWDLWVYAPALDTAPRDDIRIAHTPQDAFDALSRKEKVLLLPAPGTVKGDARGPVKFGFSPIFWNTFWTNYQPPHTLGILCDPSHPALTEFPTEFHSNWQWWDLIQNAQAMILNGLPPELRPVVQVIDDWTTCRRLGLVFEAEVDGGKLLVCGSDLSTDLDKRPVARQMRHSLRAYMASDAFRPTVRLDRDQVSALFVAPADMWRVGATASADSAHPGFDSANVLDGSPETMWHTAWEPKLEPYPHWIALHLEKPVRIKGIGVLPRQDMTNGRIGKFAVYVSEDGKTWGRPVARGSFAPGSDRQEILFRKPLTVSHLKLEALSPVDPSHPWASMADIDLVHDK